MYTDRELAELMREVGLGTPDEDLSVDTNAAIAPEARRWISHKIRYLIREEGRPPRQAVAIAYSMARKKFGPRAVPYRNPLLPPLFIPPAEENLSEPVESIEVELRGFEKYGEPWEGEVRVVDVPASQLTGDIQRDWRVIWHYGQNDVQPKEMRSIMFGDVIRYKGKRYKLMGAGVVEVSENPLLMAVPHAAENPLPKKKKMSFAEFKKRVYATKNPELIAKLEAALKKYREFHQTDPRYVTRYTINVGEGHTVDIGAEMGRSPFETYIAPPHSRKNRKGTRITYVHKYDSPEPTVVLSDGKTIIKPLQRAKVTDWIHH